PRRPAADPPLDLERAERVDQDLAEAVQLLLAQPLVVGRLLREERERRAVIGLRIARVREERDLLRRRLSGGLRLAPLPTAQEPTLLRLCLDCDRAGVDRRGLDLVAGQECGERLRWLRERGDALRGGIAIRLRISGLATPQHRGA